jgi:aminopeptidase N
MLDGLTMDLPTTVNPGNAIPLPPFSWSGATLPTNVTLGDDAITYDKLILSISDDLNSFTGSMSLQFITTAVQKGVVLHGKGLRMTRAQLGLWTASTSSYTYQESKTIAYDEAREYIFLTFPVDVPATKVELKLEWTGTVSTGTEGLYRSDYTDVTGASRTLLATQFEPNYARRVFPCFDEPAYRATFKLQLNVSSSFTTQALSNIALSGTETVGSNTIFKFEPDTPIPPIPPYLVAFVVGNMVASDQVTLNNIPIQIWTMHADQQSVANFALNAAKSFLEYYSTRLGFSYPFRKLDIVALPDFAEGAMENPGLVVFRDTAVLVDSATNPSFGSRMKVAEIVAHEIAHQWFGNVLTPYYWNDLWVAEGSATYFSYLAVDGAAINLGFDYKNTFFLAEEFMPAINADELLATSAVYGNVTTPAQARSIFSVTTYSKGASVIQHLSNQLSSSDAIWNGIKATLQRSRSVTSDEYLDLLAPTIGARNKAFIFNPTMPVLNFSFPINATDPYVVATMMSYSNFYNRNYNDTTASWYLPLSIVTPSGAFTGATTALSSTTRSVKLSTLNLNNWYKANSGVNSYYRTQYPVANWQNLINAIEANDTKLTANDRASLISDAFSWAEIGQLDYSIVLSLLKASLKEGEKNYVVWRTALSELATLRNLLKDQSCRGNFESMVKSFLLPASQYWTWSINTVAPNTADRNETSPDTPTAAKVSLRNLILSSGAEYINSRSSSRAEIESFIATPQAAVDDYMAGTPLTPDTAATFLKTALIHDPYQDWTKVLNKYKETNEPVEKARLLTALAWTAQTFKATELLDIMVNSNVIRSQDHVTVLRTLAANPEVGPDTIWNFFQKDTNADKIMSKTPQNLGYWLSTFTGLDNAFQVSSFFNIKRADLGIDPTSILEVVNDNEAWIDEFSGPFCARVSALYSKRHFTL